MEEFLINKRKVVTFYPSISIKRKKDPFKKYVDFLQYSDGKNSITKISKLINVNLKNTKKIYRKLLNNKLIT